MSTPSSTFPQVEDGWAESAFRGRPGTVEQFLGIIRADSKYSDARYSVDRAVPKHASSGNALSGDVDSIPGLAQTVTAINFAELATGSHLLPAKTLVQVSVLYERVSGAKVHVFNLPPAQAVVVQITAAHGAGEYDGKILGGSASASAGSAFVMPAGMTVPTSDNALVLNLEEQNLTGNRLLAGSYAVGVVRGLTGDSPPRPIVVIRGGVGRLDAPTTLGSTSEGSETADTTTWSKNTDATPLDLYVTTRVVYNPAGDQTLYAFVRMLTFDARGMLSAVSGETRITVDVTESCP